MPTVTIHSGLSSELLPGFQAVRTLGVDGPINGGGFGDIYALLSINGAPPTTPQVVKILKESGPGSVRKGSDTIQKLQHEIIEKNAERRRRGAQAIESYPALMALPQFSFEGTLDGDRVRGYTATRLDTAGYVLFSVILDPEEDPEPREAFFKELTWPDDPLALALELAEGFKVLEELSYIHADINPPNLFINIRDCHIAIIDFDSGAVTQDPDEKPSTFGKLADGQWLAPEISDQMTRPGSGPHQVRVDRTTDMWAVAVAIHYLLFTVGPYFFLDAVTSASLREYGQRYEWPRMAADDPMFNPDPAVLRIHAMHGDMLAQLSNELARRLAVAFRHAALNPGRRNTYFQWADLLRGALPRLGVPEFRVQPTSTVEGLPVTLRWSVVGARSVHIDGIGDVDASGTREIFPSESRSFTLRAQARGGNEIEAHTSVAVWPVPRLETIMVPAPDLTHTIRLDGLRIPAPTLLVRTPRISIGRPEVRLQFDADVSVRFPNSPPEQRPAKPFFNLGQLRFGPARPRRLLTQVPNVGEVFERIHAQIRKHIHERFGRNL